MNALARLRAYVDAHGIDLRARVSVATLREWGAMLGYAPETTKAALSRLRGERGLKRPVMRLGVPQPRSKTRPPVPADLARDLLRERELHAGLLHADAAMRAEYVAVAVRVGIARALRESTCD